MDDPGTDSLRKQAPSWTLASDEQLLTILQSTHQKLVTKCQDVNGQLEHMAAALNNSSISLQNVNNKFMALSSSQFIESRVYDDDELATEVPVVKEPPKPVVLDELTSLKRSISVLERTHEVITILHDSDTESDTDDEMTTRMVLKPKDVYANRPLPHIIGSQAWQNKWHAGLVVEQSDSESSRRGEEPDRDQYSSSSSEHEDAPAHNLHAPDTHTTVSETSSELPSEQVLVCKPTPSDVASELARRLGAGGPPKVEREPEYEEPAKPAVRKIYRPQDPISSTIFSDEPPPLSDGSDSPESDIFAELHRSQPYARAQAADDLFGFTEENNDDGDIFSDFATKPVTDPSAKPASLFEAGPTPHMFENRTNTERGPANVYHNQPSPDLPIAGTQEHTTDAETDRGVKKPVGGISLFGNKGTESIGAAILKRNQRKSSTSGDDSDADSRSETQANQQIRKEKDIFDDLFARSEGKTVTKKNANVAKDIKAAIERKKEEKVKDKKVEKPKVDLFSENLFDDIDDIFTTNVVKMPLKDDENKAKSLFEDDDDLFSEITAPKSMKIEVASSSNNKNSIFDSDDELFTENIPPPKPEKPKISEKPPVKVTETINKVKEPSRINKEVNKSIFDDDEDDIFSDVKITNKLNNATKVQNTPISNEIYNDLSKNEAQTSKRTSDFNAPKSSSKDFKSTSLFDDDDDENDLFAEPAKLKDPNIQAGFEKRTNVNEFKISQDTHSKTVVSPSSSIKNEEQSVIKNDNFNINRETKNIEINVNKTVEHDVSIKNSKDFQNVHVSENVDRNKSNTIQNTETNAPNMSEHISKIIQNAESSFDSNDNMSDPDFDELPAETNKTINNNSKIVTEDKDNKALTDNIFDDTMLKDDILAKSIDNTQITEVFESVLKNREPDVTEAVLKKTEKDNKTNVIATKNVEADIFSNILSEPPEFEKPKEPKKSKNVNALFDDDSDDESLFFKKNDTTFDDNPVDFAANQDRFGIFTDEPPDNEFSKINNDLDDDMFLTLPTPKLPQNGKTLPIPDTDNIDNTYVPQSDNNIPDFNKIDQVEDLFSTIPAAPSIHNIDTSKEPLEDIFKQPNPVTTETIEQPETITSDDELFKTPTKESKPRLPKRQLDISDDNNLFSSVPKLDKPVSFLDPSISISSLDSKEQENKSQALASKSSDEELFQSLPTLKPVPSESKTGKRDSDSKSDEELFKIPKSKPHYVPRSDNTEESRAESKSEPKKVGKLKVGLNINVNALLPGASPKKAKPNDLPDGQTHSVAQNPKPEPKFYPEHQKTENEVPESQNTDSTLKSVSFDGEPESGVLDNKLSKERPRIQVKRRPSTRRARREAVRKSAIDFGEDSTDNSSSIDDPPKNLINTDLDDAREQNQDHNTQSENTEESKDQPNSESTIKSEIQSGKVETEVPIQPETTDTQAEIPEKTIYPRDVKSKVVYILNDEDIFNTSPSVKPGTSLTSENIDSNLGVSTLGKVYNQSDDKQDSKTSLFDDENDEEIFKGKSSVKNTSLFDSDSEAELFGTSKREVEQKEKKEIKREVVKGSLFSDDDDDDLFGIKTKKSVEQKPQPSRSTVTAAKQAESVFEDPLSMFDDED